MASIPASAPSVSLKCHIDSCSGQSGPYLPQNILVDRPADQASRWSGLETSQGRSDEWIILRLDSLAVVKSITFGKYNKPHPCNLKDFKVFVGVTKDSMIEVLRAGLKNDTVPESFPIAHTNKSGFPFPTRFIKIVPMSAHGQNYHISIWHVALSGIIDSSYLQIVTSGYEEFRETAALRYILKHLRERRLLAPFHAILERSGLKFEHPLITQLHESIVLEGDWPRAERIVKDIANASLFDSYLRCSQPIGQWTRLRGTDLDGDVPSPRGGHAMCMDSSNGVLYVLGGWDGENTLDDFWAYKVNEDKWEVLSRSTSTQRNGPGARSCHKMVFDDKTGNIYVLGRLSEAGNPQSSANQGDKKDDVSCLSEFYRYHTRGTDKGLWDYLSFDTASLGGPSLVFDHQMVMDTDSQILYVFGGRVVDGAWESVKYSGLYSYNVRLNKWRELQHADGVPSTKTAIPSRFGHSMVFDPSTKTIFIFGGQRDDKYLGDMYTYDVPTHTVTELFSDFNAADGPNASFTLRAVIDPDLKEIYVFCALTRAPSPGAPTTIQVDRPMWMYRYGSRPGQWLEILPDISRDIPEPRYATQVAYDTETRTIFMHGGNAGISGALERQGNDDGEKECRLDDLWAMKLTRPPREEVIRRAKFEIRQQQFREMCDTAIPVKALGFLQTEVSSVVDHSDREETEKFRSLLTHLLESTSRGSDSSAEKEPPQKHSRSSTPEQDNWTNEIVADALATSINVDHLREKEDPEEMDVDGDSLKLSGQRFKERSEIYERLLAYVAANAKQPSGTLLDLMDTL